MRSARVILAVAAMVGVTSWSNMSAQIRWGNPETPREGVCFYEDADFHGRWFCARAGEDLSEMPRGMNDRISSIRLFGRTEVEVFKDIRYRGASARFATDVRNLQREGWNDIVSSIRVSRGSSSSWRPATALGGADRHAERRRVLLQRCRLPRGLVLRAARRQLSVAAAWIQRSDHGDQCPRRRRRDLFGRGLPRPIETPRLGRG
jgi:hypothetical protein